MIHRCLTVVCAVAAAATLTAAPAAAQSAQEAPQTAWGRPGTRRGVGVQDAHPAGASRAVR